LRRRGGDTRFSLKLVLSKSATVEPIFDPPEPTKLDTHTLQITHDEDEHTVKGCHISSLTTRNVGDMSTPGGFVFSIWSPFDPDFDNERMGVEFNKISMGFFSRWMDGQSNLAMCFLSVYGLFIRGRYSGKSSGRLDGRLVWKVFFGVHSYKRNLT
jgi:hypothetical protein